MSDTRINGGGQVNNVTGDNPAAGQGALTDVGRALGEGAIKNFIPGRRAPDGGEGGNNAGDNRPAPNPGPGNNGRGSAYGDYKQSDEGRHDGHDWPARFRENESRAQQVRSRIEGRQSGSERLGDDEPGQNRMRDGGRTRGSDDGPRNVGIRFRSYVGEDRSHAHDDESRSRGPVRDLTDSRGLFDQSWSGHGRNAPPANTLNAAEQTLAHSQTLTNENRLAANVNGLVEGTGRVVAGVLREITHMPDTQAPRLLDSAVQSAASRLDGLTGRGVNEARDVLAGALGRGPVADLGDKASDKVFRLLDHALKHINDDMPRMNEGGVLFVRVQSNVGGAHVPVARAAERLTREIVEELVSAIQLSRHLNQIEKTGGGVVRQAEAAIARALYGANSVTSALVERSSSGREPQPIPLVRPTSQEVLRDLRAGAFLPAQDKYSPFPLTGRARVAAEMMELMRTLDAVEGALQRAAALVGAAQRGATDSAIAAWLRTRMGGAVENALDELLALMLPSLPGSAARIQIPAQVAALNGILTDAEGHALLARDGTPLKLENLLWLSAAGGLLLGSSFMSESLPTRLSPSLLYGFDAIYSVIGFDGRTLAAPHFVAIQASANESEAEWLFGQQPFTDGWARELIERLKDSAVVEHNLLGEMLEEAHVDGRFHIALLSVEVSEGTPAEDSSSIKHLLPGASAAFA